MGSSKYPVPSRTRMAADLTRDSDEEASKVTTFSCKHWSRETRLFIRSAKGFGGKKLPDDDEDAIAARAAKKDSKFQDIYDKTFADLWLTRGPRPNNVFAEEQSDGLDEVLEEDSD